MAKNTGNGHRKGVVANRSQVYNTKTGKYIKRDKETGKFLSTKDTPFKNIRKETAEVKKDDEKEVIKIKTSENKQNPKSNKKSPKKSLEKK